jgi:hypothetical protein
MSSVFRYSTLYKKEIERRRKKINVGGKISSLSAEKKEGERERLFT